MEILKKIFLIGLILGSLFVIKTVLYPTMPEKVQQEGEVTEVQKPEDEPTESDVPKPKEKVYLYFIGQNSNKEDVYKIVKRDYESDGTKLDFAINELLKGPTPVEAAQGIYTEIPKGTKLRSISKINGKLYIDLSGEFEQGGGTDGLYKRLYQLIKTVNKNTTENVYLKLEGREVDVIGGEGIMISQPLTSHSLDE